MRARFPGAFYTLAGIVTRTTVIREMIEKIAWRTSARMLRFSKQRLRYYFIEEWVRFFFYTFPLAAAPTFVTIWQQKTIFLDTWATLLNPFGATALLAAVFAYSHVLSAARHIDSEYELNETELCRRNKARRQRAHWTSVRKWALLPHPYANGMQLLRFYFIEATPEHKSRHMDMEIDPSLLDLAQMEEFIVNRVGFGRAGQVPVWEPLR